MMKIWIVLPLLFIGCGPAPSSTMAEDSDDIEAETPQEWVTYKASDKRKDKHIVLVSGDEEYRSEEALPLLAQILSTHHGFDCTVLFAQDPSNPGIINPNYGEHIPGLEQLEDADLMILFTRFRALPATQMQYIEDFLLAGKPLIAIRTATHAFNFEDKDHPFSHYGYNYEGEKTDWHQGFGKRILGETWQTHHGRHQHQSTRGIIAAGAEEHPVLNGIENGAIWGPTDVYGIRQPIGGDAELIVLGQTIDREADYDENDLFYGMRESDQLIATANKPGGEASYNPNEIMPPIVWTKSYQLPDGKVGRSLTSTIGASTDMQDEEVRRLFINASYYLLTMAVPAKAVVRLPDTCKASAFGFHDDAYWEDKGLKVSDYDRIPF